MSHGLKEKIEEILALADVHINGNKPWDIQVHNDAFYQRVLSQGTLGFGEAYMEGWWDCAQIDAMIDRILKAELEKRVRPWSLIAHYGRAHLMNLQNRRHAYEIGKRHYDIGNDLYAAMLGERMVYTCGYWQGVDTLPAAQEAKLDLVCRKIGLKPGQRVLDIGCGWGSFAIFAAKKYGARVVGITVSQEQLKLAQEKCKDLQIEIRLQDYRDVREQFDHIVSLGMIEHVGYKNYRAYMQVVRRCLKDEGLFLLHTIGGNASVTRTDPWIDRYIFPNSMLPSLKQLTAACEKLFVVEDVHNFGAHYDKTLLAWFANFDAAWPQLREKYGDRFYRMWKYYLLSCAGSFRSRKNQLWQIVVSNNGVPEGYTSLR